MSRALRRFHSQRMKAKAKKIGRSVKDANHLAVCSCHMCGNPRKWYKTATFQEARGGSQMFKMRACKALR